ncbi:MAG: DNA-binding beta-propeller fold protein YncE [Candidatus Omnitrophota bacterium]|jgi:DNA-binding beta-propeller fold protein YncE
MKRIASMRVATIVVLGLLPVLISSGCRSTPAAAVPALVWPAPPALARIAYVGELKEPRDAGVRVSVWNRVVNGLTGSRRGREALVQPFGVAVDEQGNLCLTDAGTGVVQFIDQKRRRAFRWDAIAGRPFSAPVAVAKRGETLYVADSAAARVVAFDLEGEPVFDLTENLHRPSGLALGIDGLWVADAGQHAILQFDLAGKFLKRIGRRGVGPGEFNFPTHLCTDAYGRLYVVDSMNARVQIFDPEGEYLRSFGSKGQGVGQFSQPKGIAVDAEGHIFVVDALFDNVQIFDASGRLLLYFGEAGSEPGAFWLPTGIALGRDRRIHVADGYNRRIQTFELLATP